jgi:hypothetical protein
MVKKNSITMGNITQFLLKRDCILEFKYILPSMSISMISDSIDSDCFSDALGRSMGNITKKPTVMVGFL